MTWAWASSLDQLWLTPSLMVWIILAAAGVFALVLIVIVARAEKSVANAALAMIALLAIGLAAAANVPGITGGGRGGQADRPVPASFMSIAVTSCLDGLAGDAVETACERPLFGSAETAAAAVSYTANQISRVAGLAGQAKADKVMPPEFQSLRRTLERDRFGLVAHVLSARDGCTPTECAFFASLTDHNQISANMTERTYEGLIGRYALGWNGSVVGASASIAAVAPGPSGKPMSGDFPSSNSIPPVNIMTTEPGSSAPASAPPKPAAAPTPRPAAPAVAAAPAAKKPAAKKPPASTPVPLAPPSDDDSN